MSGYFVEDAREGADGTARVTGIVTCLTMEASYTAMTSSWTISSRIVLGCSSPASTRSTHILPSPSRCFANPLFGRNFKRRRLLALGAVHAHFGDASTPTERLHLNQATAFVAEHVEIIHLGVASDA